MKLKIMYPITVLLLFITIASVFLGIFCLQEKFVAMAVIVFSIGLLALLGGMVFSYFISVKSKQAVGNVASSMFKSWIIFVFIVLNMFIFIFVASKLYARFDLTYGQKYSISRPTVDLVHKLDNPMIIEYYYNDKCKEQPGQAQVVQYVLDILTEYENVSGGMIDFRPQELSYLNDREKFDELSKKGIKEFPLTQNKEDESKVARGLSGIIIKYKDKQKVLPMINQDIGFEYAIDVEIKKMLGDMGSLGIIFGLPDKSLENDYKILNQILRSEYSTVDVIASDDNIPDYIKTIVIIGGSTLTDYDAFKIDQFLMKGGRALILENGVNVIINQQYGIFGFPNDDKLIPLLDSYGIKINKDIVGDNESYIPVPQYDQSGFGVEYRYPVWPRIKKENMSPKNSALLDIKTLNLYWPSSIDVSDNIKDNTEVLFHTTKDSWSLKKSYKLDFETYKYPVQKAEKAYNLGIIFKGKVNSSFAGKDAPDIEKKEADGKITKIKYEGKKLDSGETQIAVIGDANFVQDIYFQSYLSSQNEMYLFRNLLDTLSNDQALIKIRGKGQFSMPLDKPKNRGEADFYKQIIIAVTTYVIPIILILIGIAIYILRRTRNSRLKSKYNKK